MSLFQIQVERQYLAGITTSLIPVYEKFLDYFGNPDIQANIVQVNEEQYQGIIINKNFITKSGIKKSKTHICRGCRMARVIQ